MKQVGPKEVCDILGIKKSTLYSKKRIPSFPQVTGRRKVKDLNVKESVWNEIDILRYKASLDVELDINLVKRLTATGMKRVPMAKKLGVTRKALDGFCNRNGILSMVSTADRRIRKVDNDPNSAIFNPYLANHVRCLS